MNEFPHGVDAEGIMNRILLLILACVALLQSATLYSNGGNWNVASNWGTTSGASDGTVPVQGDSVVLDANTASNVVLDVDAHVTSIFGDSACLYSINSTGYKLTVDSVFDFHTTGTWSFDDTLEVGKAIEAYANFGRECQTTIKSIGTLLIDIRYGFFNSLVIDGYKTTWGAFGSTNDCGLKEVYFASEVDTLVLSRVLVLLARNGRTVVNSPSGTATFISPTTYLVIQSGQNEGDEVSISIDSLEILDRASGVTLSIWGRHGYGNFTVNQNGPVFVSGDMWIRAESGYDVDTTKVLTNGYSITTEAILNIGSSRAGADLRFYGGSSTITASTFDLATSISSPTCTLYLESSTVVSTGNISLHPNNFVYWNTSTPFRVTGTSEITSNGASFANLQTEAPVTLVDSLTVTDTLRVQSTFNTNSQRLNVGWARFQQPDSLLTLSAMSTFGGDSVLIPTTQSATVSACTLVVDNTAVIETPGRTFARGIFSTDGSTYSWTAGDTVSFTSVSPGDHSGSASGDVTFQSTTSGSQYYLSIPAGDTATYWDVTDLWNIGETVYAKDTTNTDGGNNDGIRFTPIIDSTTSDTVQQGQPITIVGKSFGIFQGSGKGLVSDDGLSGVSWGDTEVTGNVSVQTEADSLHGVSVITQYGDTATLADQVFITATIDTFPVISSITPNSVSPLGIDTITMAGSGFTTSGDVYYGGVTITELSRTNTQIVAVTSAQTQGDTVDVIVTNAQGYADTAVNAVRIHRIPDIYCLSAVGGGGGDTVVVFLANAYATRGSGGITIGDTNAVWYPQWTDDSVYIIIPTLAADTHDIIVTNSDGERDTLINAFVHDGSTISLIILAHPEDQNAVVGGTASFNVTAAHDSTISYQWQRYVESWDDLIGATNSTYTTETLTTADDGDSMRVAVSAGAETDTSNTALLSVADTSILVIDTHPSDQSVASGATAMFTVSASSDSAITYQWQRYDTSWYHIIDATDSVYTFTGAQSIDNGDSFRVILGAGSDVDTSVSALLIVTYTVNVFTLSPSSGTPAGGTTVTATTTGGWFWEPLTVTIDGRAATEETRITDSSMTFITPIGLYGDRDVIISNSEGSSQVLSDGFEYICPKPRGLWFRWR